MMLVQGHIQEACNHKAKNTNSNTVRRFWVVVVAVVCGIRTVFGCSAVCSHAINLAAVGFVFSSTTKSTQPATILATRLPHSVLLLRLWATDFLGSRSYP